VNGSDNAIIDQLDEQGSLPNVSPMVYQGHEGPKEKLFEKLNNFCFISKCAIQQNKAEGIRNVDYNLYLLGCAIE
jgi:hypothetical protein